MTSAHALHTALLNYAQYLTITQQHSPGFSLVYIYGVTGYLVYLSIPYTTTGNVRTSWHAFRINIYYRP